MEADYNNCQGRMSDKLPGFFGLQVTKSLGLPKGEKRKADGARICEPPACL